jgi:hypothetical protein
VGLPEGPRTVMRHTLPADAIQPQMWNAATPPGGPPMTSGPVTTIFQHRSAVKTERQYRLLFLGL